MSLLSLLVAIKAQLPGIVAESFPSGKAGQEVVVKGKRRPNKQQSHIMEEIIHAHIGQQKHGCKSNLDCLQSVVTNGITPQNVERAVPLVDKIAKEIMYESTAASWLSTTKNAILLKPGFDSAQAQFYLDQMRPMRHDARELKNARRKRRDDRFQANIVIKLSDVVDVLEKLRKKYEIGDATFYDKLTLAGLVSGARLTELCKTSAFRVVCDKGWVAQGNTLKKQGKNGKDPVLAARQMNYKIEYKDLDTFHYGKPEHLGILNYVNDAHYPDDLSPDKKCDEAEILRKPFVYSEEPISKPPLGSKDKLAELMERERFVPLIDVKSGEFIDIVSSIRDELQNKHDLKNMSRKEVEHLVNHAAENARSWFPGAASYPFTFHSLRAIWVKYVTSFFGKNDTTVGDFFRRLLDHNEDDFASLQVYDTVKLLRDAKEIEQEAEKTRARLPKPDSTSTHPQHPRLEGRPTMTKTRVVTEEQKKYMENIDNPANTVADVMEIDENYARSTLAPIGRPPQPLPSPKHDYVAINAELKSKLPLSLAKNEDKEVRRFIMPANPPDIADYTPSNTRIYSKHDLNVMRAVHTQKQTGDDSFEAWVEEEPSKKTTSTEQDDSEDSEEE